MTYQLSCWRGGDAPLVSNSHQHETTAVWGISKNPQMSDNTQTLGADTLTNSEGNAKKRPNPEPQTTVKNEALIQRISTGHEHSWNHILS